MTVTTKARAWAVQRADGLVLGFTDHDGELQFGGIRFRPDHGMTARVLVQATGLSVDNSEAEGALSDEGISETDLMAGRWDDAGIRLWEVDWMDVSRRRLLFRGTLGEVTRVAGVFRAELRGLSEALAASSGRVFHRRCAAQLGDGECRVRLTDENLSLELVIGEVEDGRMFRFAVGSGVSDGWFEHGSLEILSGAAVGLCGAIRCDRPMPGGGRRVELWNALPVGPHPGDRVRLVAGCDKSARTCREKFGNFLNFRGFPHLPSEDWLIAPQTGGQHG